MIAVLRRDSNEWALPGGLVDVGEPASVSLLREFQHETGGAFGASAAEKGKMEKLVKMLFSSGEILHRGYVDDPRNTDHAWIETTAVHFHCSRDLAQRLRLR